MALETSRTCDHCGQGVGRNFFGMTFSEMAPPDLEALSTADPAELRRGAERATERAEELGTRAVNSDEARAFRARLLEEAEALAAESERVDGALEALRDMAGRGEPLVAFGSGALDFCSGAHAAAYLQERYGPQGR